LTIFSNPVKYDATLSALLESSYDGIQVKKILEAVAIQENTSVWVDDGTSNKLVDANLACKNFLSPVINEPYVLKVVLSTKEIMVVENTIPSMPNMPTHFQETSTKLFLLNGDDAELKLLVYVK
jgi:hypothetical protein